MRKIKWPKTLKRWKERLTRLFVNLKADYVHWYTRWLDTPGSVDYFLIFKELLKKNQPITANHFSWHYIKNDFIQREKVVSWWYLVIKPIFYELSNTRLFFFWRMTFKKYPWWKKIAVLSYVLFQIILFYALCFYFTAAFSVVLLEPAIRNMAFNQYRPMWHKTTQHLFQKTFIQNAWATTLLRQNIVPRVIEPEPELTEQQQQQINKQSDAERREQNRENIRKTPSWFNFYKVNEDENKRPKIYLTHTEPLFAKSIQQIERARYRRYEDLGFTIRVGGVDRYKAFYGKEPVMPVPFDEDYEQANYLKYSKGQQRLFRTLPYKKFWLAYYEAKYRLWANLTWQQLMRKTWLTKAPFSIDTNGAHAYVRFFDTERSITWNKRVPVFKDYVLNSKAYSQLADHGTIYRHKGRLAKWRRRHKYSWLFRPFRSVSNTRKSIAIHVLDRARNPREGGMYNMLPPTYPSWHYIQGQVLKLRVHSFNLMDWKVKDFINMERNRRLKKRWSIKRVAFKKTNQPLTYLNYTARHIVKERLRLASPAYPANRIQKHRMYKGKLYLLGDGCAPKKDDKYNYRYLHNKDILKSFYYPARSYGVENNSKHADFLQEERFLRTGFNIMTLPSIRHRQWNPSKYVRRGWATRALPGFAMQDILPKYWNTKYQDSFVFVTKKDFQFRKYLFNILVRNQRFMALKHIRFLHSPIFFRKRVLRRDKKHLYFPRIPKHGKINVISPGILYSGKIAKSRLYNSRALHAPGMGLVRYITRLNSHNIFTHTLWRKYSYNKFKAAREPLYFDRVPKVKMIHGRRYHYTTNQMHTFKYAIPGSKRFTRNNPNHPKNMKFGFKYLAYSARRVAEILGLVRERPIKEKLVYIPKGGLRSQGSLFSTKRDHPDFGKLYNNDMYKFYKKSFENYNSPFSLKQIKFYNYDQVDVSRGEMRTLLDEKTQIPLISHYKGFSGKMPTFSKADFDAWHAVHTNTVLTRWWNKVRKDRKVRGRKFLKRDKFPMTENKRLRRMRYNTCRKKFLLYPTYTSRASGLYSRSWATAFQQHRIRRQHLRLRNRVFYRIYPTLVKPFRFNLNDYTRNRRYVFSWYRNLFREVSPPPKWERHTHKQKAKWIKNKYNYTRIRFYNDYNRSGTVNLRTRYESYRHPYGWWQMPIWYRIKKRHRKASKQAWRPYMPFGSSFARIGYLFDRAQLDAYMRPRIIFKHQESGRFGIQNLRRRLVTVEDVVLPYKETRYRFIKKQQAKALRIFAISHWRWTWLNKYAKKTSS